MMLFKLCELLVNNLNFFLFEKKELIFFKKVILNYRSRYICEIEMLFFIFLYEIYYSVVLLIKEEKMYFVVIL